ncbi:unnamed protein product, partial [Polarella glacialis]
MATCAQPWRGWELQSPWATASDATTADADWSLPETCNRDPWAIGPAIDQPIHRDALHRDPGQPWKVLVNKSLVDEDEGLAVKEEKAEFTFDACLDWQNALFMNHFDTELPAEQQCHSDKVWGARANDWAAVEWLQPGTTVCFQGLRIAQDLNGQCGVVEGWDGASYRWKVRMVNGEDKFAKMENLVVVCPPARRHAEQTIADLGPHPH